MFRTKKDVDRHVQDIFRKVKNENEKNLRCYNIAKLYYQVGDYESARRYVSTYLEVQEKSAGAHKLLGQTLEALGQKEGALTHYKVSLELEGRQDDLVLKICELLTEMDIGTDVNNVRYWVERADRLFPHHPTVFQLKEKMLTVEITLDNSEDLEALIISELSVRPMDVHLHVKLLKHYIAKQKLDKAFNHASNVEATYNHRNSIIWYQSLAELLIKCKDSKQSDWTFWVLYVSVLERYAALSLKEQGNDVKKTVPEATQAVFNFDQSLTQMKLKNFTVNPTFIENMFTHMWGQLNFHMACLFLRKTKREQGSWSEAGRLCAPLLLSALHSVPVDFTASWTIHLKDQLKNQIKLWHKEGSYRCSQSGHVLQDYARDDVQKLMDKIDKFCSGSWRVRLYQRIFVSRVHQQLIVSSYFSTHTASNPPLRLCSYNELKRYDEISEEVWPDSLHHQVWLGLKSRPRSSQNKDSGPYPHQYCHIFPDLQFSVYNLNQAAPDSLSRLDIDAFLNAATLCSSVIVEEQQLSGFVNPERLQTLPADITNTLCTCAQEKWWSSAYKLYSKQEFLEADIGEIRQELQRGLEVVRCIGNHGLHPTIIVHLARIFNHRAKALKEKDKEHSDIPALEARSELYWSTAIPLLERLQNNQTIRISNFKLFDYQGKEMNNVELTNALEEGRLLLVQRFLRDKLYDRAIDSLQTLKCPEASFQQGQIYKMLADEIVSSMPRESLTSETRSQHSSMLLRARNCFYLTLDRLRAPGENPKHPLNLELDTYIDDIENELKRINPDIWQGNMNRNECDSESEKSYSSAHSCIDQPVANVPLPAYTGMQSSVNMLSTPQRNTHRTPKYASTPAKPQHQDVLDLSRNRTEARPSPERLDAQIRQILHARDSEMKTVVEQYKTITKSIADMEKTIIDTMMDKIEELKKEIIAELRKDSKRQRVQSVSMNPNLEEDPYVLGEEDYSDLNYNANQSGPNSSISGTMFPPSHRHLYSSLVYPPATAFQGYYQGTIPFSDPNAQAIPSLYPPNVYPMPMLYPSRSKVPENMLQQGLFPSRLPTQRTDVIPPASQPMQQIPVQKAEIPKTETAVIKDVPVNKAPPVNIVITTSDTLPTTAPVVQPTLSVTIPPQYRLGTTTTAATTTEQSNAPHSYQISMPSQATIPTTVNLPPLSATLTTTPANISMPETPKPSSSVICSTGSPNSSAELCETEHDPIPDFVPVVPLPAEVKVTTGEEDEVTLYCARAKLFRFVDKEWKERGVGNVKLLRNTEGKVRLLMRRDQVLKICANHMLRHDMELTSMPNNEKAWIWVANDFADEELKLEKLCIRFKTVEEAQSFKEHFDKARASLTQSPEKSKTYDTNKIAGKVDASDSAKTKSKLSAEETFASKPTIQKQVDEATSGFEAGKAKPTTTTTSTMLGGFSFTTKPTIQKVDAKESKTPQKAEDPPKVNPFAGISFGKSAAAKSSETTMTSVTPLKNATIGTPSTVSQATGFSFAKAATFVTSQSEVTTTSVSPAVPNTTTVFPSHKAGDTEIVAANSQPALRRPHMPSPSVQETGESIIFEQKATLRCYNKDTKQWQNKGAGQIRVLLHAKSNKLKLLMLEEGTSKVCYNQVMSPKVKFTFKNNTVVTWTTETETFECTFKSSDLASQCYVILTSYQQQGLGKDKVADRNKKNETKKTSQTSNDIANHTVTTVDTSKPLSELFKPPPGSWECNTCCTRNAASHTKCVACESPSPVANNKTPSSTTVSKDQVPLSQMFKPAPGSWKCSACLIVNSSTNSYCVACDTAKDPSMPPKQKTAGFQLGTTSSETVPTFSFGIPQKPKEATSAFNFSLSKPEEKDTKATTIFGVSNKPDDSGAKFVFGASQRPSTPPNKDTSFTFGSPGKSFEFQFYARSPGKSPGGGENSEEEVPENDDIQFAPVIPLPAKIEVKTGEEDEEILYSHRAKLFRFDTTAKEWKERGLGDIKLLKHKETGKLRLIMRRDQILKLCLNHFVLPDLEFRLKDEKTWLWNAADYSEGEIEHIQFACRFKTAEIAESFKKAVDDARTNATVEKPTKEGKVPPDQDIEVVYELKVTAEEKAAAKKLQLPENFYSYKYKEDCPGCIGCKDPEDDNSRTGGTSQKAKEPTESTKAPIFATSTKTIPASSGTMFSGAKPSIPTFDSSATSASPFALKTTTPSTNIFGGATMSFGNNKSDIFSDKKSTFSFGASPHMNIGESPFGQSAPLANTDKQGVLVPEDTKICSPSVSQDQQATTTAGQHPFGTSIFKTSGQTENIFGGASKTSNSSVLLKSSSFNVDGSSFSFSNAFTTQSKTGSLTSTTSSTANTSTFDGTLSVNLFGSPATQPSTTTNMFAGTTSLSTSNTGMTGPFGISNTSNSSVFPNTTSTPFSSWSFGVNNSGGSVFGNSGITTASPGNIFSTKAAESEPVKEDVTCFLPTNNITFSDLASKCPQQPSFKTDPNFSFDGAGSTVFGSKTSNKSSTSSQEKKAQAKNKEENEEEEYEENDDEQEHDPEFKPIVPLPDPVEVRTGEEEEDKVFCERAKLYRYDNGTKEWKERGVGEMKVLHHAKYGTYRLVLRREQVHKVVCNFLITPDVEFRPLSSSDRAWMWAGMNHIEGTSSIEELAVKFKNADLAKKFKVILEKVQQTLREKQSSQGEKDVSDGKEKEEEEVEEEEDEIEDDEDDEDDDDDSIVFEERATLCAKTEEEDEWRIVASGNLAICYDSNILSAKIIQKADESDEVVSDTIISMDIVMEIEGNECVWSAIDRALKPPVNRTLKAVFSSTQAAQQMYKHFQDGLEHAKEAGVSVGINDE